MKLTAKELKKALKNIPDDSVIRFQYIEDKYIKGYKQNSTWYGNKNDEYTKLFDINRIREGWETYDTTCDLATTECGGENFAKCRNCPSRNRYIDATRCFVIGNELFIDGHY